MLSQQLQQMPDTQNGNQHTSPLSSTSQQAQPQLPPQIGQLPRPGPDQVRELIRAHPELLGQLQQRHANNQQGLLLELSQMAAAGAGRGQPLPMGSFQQFQQQQPQQQMQQPPQQQQQLQQQPQQPQPSQFQNMQSLQNLPTGGMNHIDPKQMEAVSL